MKASGAYPVYVRRVANMLGILALAGALMLPACRSKDSSPPPAEGGPVLTDAWMDWARQLQPLPDYLTTYVPPTPVPPGAGCLAYTTPIFNLPIVGQALATTVSANPAGVTEPVAAGMADHKVDTFTIRLAGNAANPVTISQVDVGQLVPASPTSTDIAFDSLAKAECSFLAVQTIASGATTLFDGSASPTNTVALNPPLVLNPGDECTISIWMLLKDPYHARVLVKDPGQNILVEIKIDVTL